MAFFLLVAILVPPISGGGISSVQARSLFAATPDIGVTTPGDVMLGEAFTFSVTFDNAGSDTGYGPFIDVLFPLNGADGAPYAVPPETQDGVDFNSTTGATYLGNKLECEENEFDENGEATHPFARDTGGDYLTITGTPGDKLVSCKLPFGSFVPSQPQVAVTFNAQLSDLADVGTALPIRARGGFMYGSDPLDNWCCDAVILSPTSNNSNSWQGGSPATITPTIMTMSKTGSPTDNETATGPNFPRTYTITVDIADGQQVDHLTISDTLPDNVQFLGMISPASCAAEPSTTSPGGSLSCNLGAVTGGSGSSDAQIQFSFYIPLEDAAAVRVLPETTGASSTSENDAQVEGDWLPDDVRDQPSQHLAIGTPPSTDYTHTNKSIPIQKTSDVVGGGEVIPGATVEFTLEFQVSDYFAFENVTVDDVLSDGFHFDSSFNPALTVHGNGYTFSSQDFHHSAPNVNYTVSCNYTGGPGAECDLDDPASNTGKTTITFNIADEIVDQGQVSGNLVGGCVPPAGLDSKTPAYDLNCDAGNNGYNNGSTTGTIVYRAVIQEEFADDYPSGDQSVDQGDELSNSVTISGTVLNNTDMSTTGNPVADTAGASETVPRNDLSKNFYAINGDTNLNNFVVDGEIHIKPGDELTYQLKYTLVTSDVEDLYLMDYLPLPILDVDDPDADGSNGPAWTFTGKCSGAIPVAGSACFGSADTFYDYSSVTPSVASDVDGNGNPDDEANTLRFFYGDYDSTSNQSKVIEILFTIAVNTEPFADGLYLTNQARVHEGSTNSTAKDDDAIVDFVLDEPLLVHKKSVIATDNSSANLSPALSAYSFTAPGSSGLRWTSPAKIDSTYLKSNPINSDITNSDGGDLVSFAIVIENQGHSGDGAFDLTIKDSLPSDLQIPAGGLNLDIRYGDGTGPISYTRPDDSAATATDLFGGGIKLVDPVGQGVCQAHDPNLGNNIIIITYDLQVKNGVAPGTEIENSGTITNYSNKEGGDDFTGSGGSGQEGDLVDKAKISISDPAVAKSIAETSISTTGTAQHDPALEDLTIGEDVTFKIIITLPEGNSTAVTVTDNLPKSPAGILSVQSSCVTSVGANLTLTNNPAGTCPTSFGTHNNTDADAYIDQVVFDFGDVTNTVDGVEDAKDQIVLQVVAKVEAHDANEDGDKLTNTVQVTAGSSTQNGSVDFEIVEPDLDIADNKTDGVDYFAAGGLLVYTITYQNNGTGTATGVKITDTVPTGTTFVASSSTTGWVLPGTSTACPDGAAAGTACEYPIGELTAGAAAQTVDFAVRVDDPLAAGISQITNSATIDDEYATDDSDPTNDAASDTNNLAVLGKSLIDTNQAFSLGSDVVIGEILTYRVVLSIPPDASPPGSMPNLSVTDDLDAGLAFMDCVGVTASANLTTNLPGGFSDACVPDSINPTTGNPAIYPLPTSGAGSSDDANQGRRLVFDLGNVSNTSTGTANETITLEYRVVVLDSADNVRNVLLNNNAQAAWNQGSTSNSLTAQANNVTIQEPAFQMWKTANLTTAYPGAVVTFQIEVRHDVNSIDTFDVELTDPLPSGFVYQPGTLVVAQGLAADVIDDSDPRNLRVVWNSFPAVESAIIEFNAVIVGGGTNTTYLAWTSLPGDVASPQSDFNVLSTERFYDPPSSIDIYGLSASFDITVKGGLLPETGFPPGRVTTPQPSEGASPWGFGEEMWLSIPSQGIRVPVVGVPFTEQGWDLSWLSAQAGYLDGTAYPTWPGNSVLTGHAYLQNGMPGPFAAIDHLRWGDEIVLNAGDARYVYQVRERDTIKPDDWSPFQTENLDWVTLMTCNQYDETLQAYRWRVVVRAVLVDVTYK